MGSLMIEEFYADLGKHFCNQNVNQWLAQLDHQIFDYGLHFAFL